MLSVRDQSRVVLFELLSKCESHLLNQSNFIVYGGKQVTPKIKGNSDRKIDVYIGKINKGKKNSCVVSAGDDICVVDLLTGKHEVLPPNGGDVEFDKSCGCHVERTDVYRVVIHMYEGDAYKAVRRFKAGKTQQVDPIAAPQPPAQPPAASQPQAGQPPAGP